jgi:hypothetical protein
VLIDTKWLGVSTGSYEEDIANCMSDLAENFRKIGFMLINWRDGSFGAGRALYRQACPILAAAQSGSEQ